MKRENEMSNEQLSEIRGGKSTEEEKKTDDERKADPRYRDLYSDVLWPD